METMSDNELNLKILIKLLTVMKCEVHSAIDGTTALEKIDELLEQGKYPDIIHCDLEMMPMDGRKCVLSLDWLLSSRPLPPRPLTVTSRIISHMHPQYPRTRTRGSLPAWRTHRRRLCQREANVVRGSVRLSPATQNMTNGRSTHRSEDTSYSAGMSAFLRKPFNKKQLEEVTRKFISW